MTFQFPQYTKSEMKWGYEKLTETLLSNGTKQKKNWSKQKMWEKTNKTKNKTKKEQKKTNIVQLSRFRAHITGKYFCSGKTYFSWKLILYIKSTIESYGATMHSVWLWCKLGNTSLHKHSLGEFYGKSMVDSWYLDILWWFWYRKYRDKTEIHWNVYLSLCVSLHGLRIIWPFNSFDRFQVESRFRQTVNIVSGSWAYYIRS